MNNRTTLLNVRDEDRRYLNVIISFKRPKTQ